MVAGKKEEGGSRLACAVYGGDECADVAEDDRRVQRDIVRVLVLNETALNNRDSPTD